MVRSKRAVRLPSLMALKRLRALKWRQCPERRLRQERDIAEFLRELGLCLIVPVSRLPLPSWIEAAEGRRFTKSAAARRGSNQAHAQGLKAALDNLIQQRVVFETNCLWRTPILVARELFPNLYAIAGDLNPEEDYLEQQRRGELGTLAVAVYEAILREGPVVRADLQKSFGFSTGRELEALGKTLNQLARTLKVVRASHTPEHGPAWDAFYRWAPEVVREARSVTRLEAAMKIVAAFVSESIVVARATAQKLFRGFLTPEVCGRAIDLLVESGQLVESRNRLAVATFLSR